MSTSIHLDQLSQQRGPVDAVTTPAAYATSDNAKSTTTRRRRVRRRLNGSVTVWFSSRIKYPKLHLVRDCEALLTTPDEAVGTSEFASVFDLAITTVGRPCRMCALESVLLTVLHPDRRRSGQPVFFTSSSQANPLNPDAGIRSFNWSKATESGEARLQRVARRSALPTTRTNAGIVVWGWTDQRGAAALAANIRTVVRPDHNGDVNSSIIEIAWSLLNDTPPELQGDSEDNLDPLILAARLLA